MNTMGKPNWKQAPPDVRANIEAAFREYGGSWLVLAKRAADHQLAVSVDEIRAAAKPLRDDFANAEKHDPFRAGMMRVDCRRALDDFTAAETYVSTGSYLRWASEPIVDTAAASRARGEKEAASRTAFIDRRSEELLAAEDRDRVNRARSKAANEYDSKRKVATV